MDYNKIYDSLITKARNRILEGYKEVHHIVPRCVGGTDEESNLVPLTPEEHFIAHILLTKIYPNNPRIIFAANMMCNRNNKVYGWLKRAFGQAISQHLKGRIVPLEQREKMSKTGLGRTKSQEHKTKIGAAHLQTIEYNGQTYKGYQELLEKTGISYHLYRKYYTKGIDPIPFVNNAAHGWRRIRTEQPHPRAAAGKKWYTNGSQSRYFFLHEVPTGWVPGRLVKKRGS